MNGLGCFGYFGCLVVVGVSYNLIGGDGWSYYSFILMTGAIFFIFLGICYNDAQYGDDLCN